MDLARPLDGLRYAANVHGGMEMIGSEPLKTDDWLPSGLVGVALCVVTSVALAAGPPAGARRESPPPAIEATAISVGALAPSFELPSAGGERLALARILAKGPAVIVFYRGYW